MTDAHDPERDRLTGRLRRVATVGTNAGAAALAFGQQALFGGEEADRRIAAAVKAALGRTKGPLMKVAQMMATIPDFLPPEYAAELAALQSNAPAMGWPFVKRRMRAELGEGWETRFAQFEREACAAASLGQVHAAVLPDGRRVACKLQYPDMASAVESDVAQLNALFGLVKSFGRAVDPTEMGGEIADRLREELDYEREAKHMRLYADVLSHRSDIRLPQPVEDLCTRRLLTMTWLDGGPLMAFTGADQTTRNRIAEMLFAAWWAPMTQAGVIHGDPHLGNYSFADGASALNLLDFGCVRIFPPAFVEGVVNLYRALRANDHEASAEAYRAWGFGDLSRELVDVLNLWARFIYGPMLEDRVRSVADGVKPGEYGRREAFAVKKELDRLGPVKVPREFVFMDRAAIGLGAAFLHLGAELNFHALFEASLDGFSREGLAARQASALAGAGLGHAA